MPSPTRRHRAGFTVVEALAAGTVLALSALVISAAARQAMDSLQVAGDYQRAAELLDGTLTKIDLMGPDRLAMEGPTEGRFAPPDDRFSWKAEFDQRAEGYLYEVSVSISWQTARGVRSIDAQTLLNDSPGSRSMQVEWDEL